MLVNILINALLDVWTCLLSNRLSIDFFEYQYVKMIQESNAKFDHINVDELGLYLSLCVNERSLIEQDLYHFFPTSERKRKRPTITVLNVTNKS